MDKSDLHWKGFHLYAPLRLKIDTSISNNVTELVMYFHTLLTRAWILSKGKLYMVLRVVLHEQGILLKKLTNKISHSHGCQPRFKLLMGWLTWTTIDTTHQELRCYFLVWSGSVSFKKMWHSHGQNECRLHTGGSMYISNVAHKQAQRSQAAKFLNPSQTHSIPSRTSYLWLPTNSLQDICSNMK